MYANSLNFYFYVMLLKLKEKNKSLKHKLNFECLKITKKINELIYVGGKLYK